MKINSKVEYHNDCWLNRMVCLLFDACMLFLYQGHGVPRDLQCGEDLTPDHLPVPDPGRQSGRHLTPLRRTTDWLVVLPIRERYFPEDGS